MNEPMVLKFLIVCSFLTSCNTPKENESIWLQVNRYPEVPADLIGIQQLSFYLSNNSVTIQSKSIDSVVTSKSSDEYLVSFIRNPLIKQNIDETVNTFIMENGKLKAQGHINIDSLVFKLKRVHHNVIDRKASRTLSDISYNEYQLNYLEYFANSVYTENLNKQMAFEIVDIFQSFKPINYNIYFKDTLVRDSSENYFFIRNGKKSTSFKYEPVQYLQINRP